MEACIAPSQLALKLALAKFNKAVKGTTSCLKRSIDDATPEDDQG